MYQSQPTSTLSSSSSSSSSTLFNPYQLLLSNRSKRPNELPSYVILFQHSNDLEIRFRAATPSTNLQGSKKHLSDHEKDTKIKTNTKKKSIYEQAGLLNPRESAILDSTGFLWIQKTFYELCQQYDGKFIFIRAVGNWTPCFQSKFDNQNVALNQHQHGIRQFCQNGQMIDLVSDPLGWDSDIDSDDCNDTKTIENKYNHTIHSNTVTCQLDNLDAIATTISKAALSIMNHSSNLKNTSIPQSSSSFINHTNFQIPIFFDSLHPLLIAHGVHYTIALIQRLSCNHHSPYSSISDTKTNKVSSLPPLSPIFLPVLTSALHPSHHRLLEDASHAIVHLKEGTCNIVRKSHRGTGKITKESQPFCISSEVNMGVASPSVPCIQFQSSRMNTDNDDKEKNIDQTIYNSSNKNKSDNVISDVTFKLGQLTPQEQAMRNATVLPHHKSRSIGQRNKVTIQMENDDNDDENNKRSQKGESQKQKTGPKIYLEDDDPEFDDMDEEDPDDDLDL